MLDRLSVRLVHPPLAALARPLAATSVRPDHITIAGFAIGVLAVPALAGGYYGLALLFIVLNRICDGLDGALAREVGISDAGGFLDITLDFIFYALIPLGFALADPIANAIPGAVLITAFVATGSSFLAFAVQAGKRGEENPAYPNKSFYYLGGLTEGTETIICFIIACLWPSHFPLIAYIFAALCGVTAITRIKISYDTLSKEP